MNKSIINTNGNTKIFSTNNINKIEVSTENIIESDSEFREVIKKGYLLSQINLSSIPDIIQDAINAAILDAKTQTLADALIENLRNSIDNLNDGIYKKTFINNTISYLEELIIQKASPEIVAAIAEAKIAVATENFAAASVVQLISSKVNNSEAEIIKVNETIATNEVARTKELTDMEARINDIFAGYSEAVDLYVDAEGNVKAQKIETLSTNIGLQIQELDVLITDAQNDWSAKSLKLITNPSGGITGYSFQDGSGIKSNFDINADNFKISNSYNTYSPFSIVGTSLYFNGKISFTNTTNVPNFVLTNTLNTELAAVNTNITNAQNSANNANSLLSDIANDNKLTPDEKINTKKEWDIIVSEKNKNVAQANTYSVSVIAYNSTYDTLNTYITPLLSNLTITSDIVGSTFRSMFKLYYDARTDLLNAIANKIKTDLTNAINNLAKVEDISWQQEVQDAINNNATYIDGGKIVTNQVLVNNINATGGIIAETVTANEFVGKTFTGAVINGAVINGAVVKASYLDLDGQLEVLTNYHITPVMYNANPSLYTDAVYLSGNNEYRIPSISMIREPDTSVNISNGGNIFNSKIRSYNTANVGHNIKCVNVRPRVTCSSLELFKLNIEFYTTALQNRGNVKGVSDSFDVYIVGIKFGTFYINQETSYFDVKRGLYKDGQKISSTSNYTFNGFNISVAGGAVSSGDMGINYGGFTVMVESIATDTLLPYNFDNTSYSLFYIKNNGGNTLQMYGQPSNATLNITATAKTSSSLYINNMI